MSWLDDICFQSRALTCAIMLVHMHDRLLIFVVPRTL